jgi:hypothetical protein
MNTQKAALFLVATSLLIGCTSASDPGSTRTVTGQLTATGYQLDNPVVVAESSDHRVFVTHLSAKGYFQLALPPNTQYRLTLANSTRSGTYSAVARINWPLASGAGRWANLGAGAPLALGHVYRRGTSAAGLSTSCASCDDSQDSDGGVGAGDDDGYQHDCKQDDGANTTTTGNEGDCDCDHKHQSSDHCDGDADGESHDRDCDDHEKAKEGCGGSEGEYGTEHDDDDEGDYHHASNNMCVDGGSAPAPTPTPAPGPTPPTGGGTAGSACVVNADCSGGLSCVMSVCTASGPVV